MWAWLVAGAWTCGVVLVPPNRLLQARRSAQWGVCPARACSPFPCLVQRDRWQCPLVAVHGARTHVDVVLVVICLL